MSTAAPSQPARTNDAQPPRGWRRVAARTAYLAILLAVKAAVRVGNLLHRRRSGDRTTFAGDPKRLLLTGTFYNVGWVRSHLPPLSAAGALDRVFVVCDAPVLDFPKVTYACPPKWLRRVAGRTLARAWTIWRVARSERCGALMGYHIMPNGLLCLALGRLLNRRVLYQMTGGPAQLEDGGWRSENALLRRLGGPSVLGKRWLYGLVREMDDVLVRGAQAESFLRRERLARSCRFLPGSIDVDRFSPPAGSAARPYDLVTVGRLAWVKRYDRLLEIMAALVRVRPQSRLLVVGDGPLRGELERQRDALGLEAHVDIVGSRADVGGELRKARLFVLTSESEGLSIAQIEAMACGLPPVTPDVGDLGMLLRPGENGEFIDPTDAAGAAQIVADLLTDEPRLARYAAAARSRVLSTCSVGAVAATWDELLGAVPAPVVTGDGVAHGAIVV